MKFKITIFAVLCTAVVAVSLMVFQTPGTSVSCVLAGYENIEVSLEVSGEYVPENIYNVVSTVQGTVNSVSVEEGDIVNANSIVMTVGSSISTDAVQANSHSYANSYSVADTIRRAQNGSMSITDFATAFLPQDLEVFGNQAVDTQNLRSELNGEVLTVNFSQGDAISPGVTTAIIASSEKKIVALIPQNEINSVSIGQQCSVVVEGSEIEHSGSIVKIANTVQTTATGQKMVSVDIAPTANIDAISGSDVDVSIILEKKYDVLSIDTNCLISANTVFVANTQGVLELREVDPGISNDYIIEINSGINAGEYVVKNPDRTLNAGDKVQIVD